MARAYAEAVSVYLGLSVSRTANTTNWIAEITGSFKDDPDFDEIVRLGKEMRDAELPEED